MKAEARHNLKQKILSKDFFGLVGSYTALGGNTLKTRHPRKVLGVQGQQAKCKKKKKKHLLSSLFPSEVTLGFTRTSSEVSRITTLKPNDLLPLEVNHVLCGGEGQAAAGSLMAWHNPEPDKGHREQEVRKAAMTQTKNLQPWEMTDWCAERGVTCKRHCNCFIFAWHLRRVSLLGLYLSPTADWDFREENLMNLLRLYEYKRFCNNTGSIYLRYLHNFGEMFT